MDGSPRGGPQPTNDRQLLESRTRYSPGPMSEPNHNADPVPSNKYLSSPNTLPKLRISGPLHFDYPTRYPSPPPTDATRSVYPPQPFAYPSPISAQRSIRNHAPSDRRSPPPHSSRRTNGSTSSPSDSPMMTLPPLSSVPYRPPMHRGLDHVSNHHTLSPPITRKRSQMPRDNPEQLPPRRHTLDSDQQKPPSTCGPKRTLSSVLSPSQPHRSPPTQQVPPPTSKPCSSPTSSRHENPPISPSLSTVQPPQRPQSPQSTITDEPLPIPDTSVPEAVEAALEPLRFGFENIWTLTVQNVRQVMNKMQKDLTRLIATERRKNVNLMRCLVNNSEKLKSQEWALDGLKKENAMLIEKGFENGRLRKENSRMMSVIDTLNMENDVLRRENDELKRMKEEALSREGGFVYQYKQELVKMKADADVETVRKSMPSGNDAKPQTTVASSDLHSRLHTEKERERVFNDTVKQLRALTALEGNNSDPMRERDLQEVVAASDMVDRDCNRCTPSSLETKGNLSPSSIVAKPHYPINERPPTLAGLTNSGDKSKVEADEPDSREVKMDVDEDKDDVIPIASIRTTTDIDAEHFEPEKQSVDEPRNPEEESELQLDLESQRQRQRQSRRGRTTPSPVSSPQARSKTSSVTGMKRNRNEYEDGQVVEDHNVRIEKPGERREENLARLVRSPASVEAEGIHIDAEEGEITLDQGQELKDVTYKSWHITADVMLPRTEIQLPVIPLYHAPMNPKAVGRWPYYKDFKHHGVPTLPTLKPFITQQSTSLLPPPPSTQASQRLPKRLQKLGINHMDLLYKTEKEAMTCRICLSLEQNADATVPERRKAKANTKKFPLNASWADLIDHCQTEHAKACEDMEKLSPSQIAEMKQRMPPVIASSR